MPTPFSNLGYKPPVVKDSRNWELESVQPTQAFPSSVITDITPFKQPEMVYMQYQVPDCVENAVSFALRYKMWKSTGIIPSLCRRDLAIKTVAADGVPFEDGTSLQVALSEAWSKGIGDTQYFADDHSLDNATFIGASVPQAETDSATSAKVPGYAFLTDLSVNGLKNAINQNGIVLIGIKVSDQWWTAPNGEVSWNMGDVLPIRPIDANHPEISGHAIALYGYDTEYFYFMNWWSADWGDKGHGWFGVNEVPAIYEAATIGNFVKPTTPAPVKPQVIEQLVEEPKESIAEAILEGVENFVVEEIKSIVI